MDSTGPRINASLNDRNFRSGGVVNENFKLIADMFDESGINTTGTIGHRIEATLDGNESNKYDLTSYYNSDTSYKSGSLAYDFTGIANGTHTLKLRAWDTYNNSSQVTISFDVVTSGVVQVMNVYNFPNPFRDGTAFTYQHNYPGLVTTKIKIYTVARAADKKKLTSRRQMISLSIYHGTEKMLTAKRGQRYLHIQDCGYNRCRDGYHKCRETCSIEMISEA